MSSRVKDVHSSADSLEITPLATKVPQTEAEIAAFRERVKANAFLTSLFVSDDGRATSMLVDFDDFEKAGGSQAISTTSWRRSSRPSARPIWRSSPPARRRSCTGCSIYTRRVALLFVLALAMIGYLHYRAFRTLQGMIIPLVTAIMGVVWALGLMGLIGAPMDPWNIMTPILLLAIGAGHSVQILKRYYEEYKRLHARAGRPARRRAQPAGGHRGDDQGRPGHAGGGDDRRAQLRLAGDLRPPDDQELRPLHRVRDRRGADRGDDLHPRHPRADVAAVGAPDRAREARGVLRPDPREAGATGPRRPGAADRLGVLAASSSWR